MLALKTVPADHLPGGFGDFRIREDLIDSYKRVLTQARVLGGIVTSSGALRDLHEPATAGRSRTSLHYTGRAIDLYIESGMRSVDDPYAVVPTVSGSRVTWTVWCESVSPKADDPSFNPALVQEMELECAIWKAGIGFVTAKRTGRFFSLTGLFKAAGWQPIPARADWKTNYLSCEWWHFQNQRGLMNGVTKFGDELRSVWPSALVAQSGLALNAIWSGQSFKVATADGSDGSHPAPPAGDEKVAWIQAVLNATRGESLVVDGRSGAKTSAALRHFQAACEIEPTGICDATTETALIQRALERLGNTPFPHIGERDQATTNSLAEFQRAARLDADGVMGPRTRAAMTERLRGRDAASLPRLMTSRRRRPARSRA
jgi:hypothetical protein